MENNIFKLLRDKHISAIPVNSDKTPMVSWKTYQERLQTVSECEKWRTMQKGGIAVVCGKISNNLEIIDIDNKINNATAIFEDICKQIKHNRPKLFDNLVIEKSKNNGYHIIYRCEKIEGNKKLAKQDDQDGNVYTIIETRGEGGYCLVYPTPHYERIQKNILGVNEITIDEREYLFTLCKMYNTIQEKEANFSNFKTYEYNENTDKIGDLYNQKDDFIDVLQKHGWTIIKNESDKIHFKRPGKQEKTNSATFLLEPRLLYVFSTNAYPFESECSYSPFAIYTLLEANGDFKLAVKQLLEQYPEFDKKNNMNNKKTTTNKAPKEPKKSELFEFWTYKNENEIVINVDLLVRFLDKNNIYYYYKENQDTILVYEKLNVLKKIDEDFVVKFIQNYIDNLPSDYKFDDKDIFDKEAVRTAFNNFSDQKFRLVMNRLSRRDVEINHDEPGIFYKYFDNVVVKYEKGNNYKVELLEYKDLKKKVWFDKIIDGRFFRITEYENFMVYKFHKNVTSSQENSYWLENYKRFLALRSALGYMLYEFKNENDVKVVVFCEEQVTDQGGRTGKTLTCQMLEKMGSKMVKINGRKVDFSNRFLFQNVDVDTNIIQFDDTDSKFDFSSLYSIVTNGLTVEKKGRKAIQLTHQQTPKFIITSNSVLTDESNSGKSRKFEVEFSDYYNDERTPIDEFEKRFFSGWDEAEWNLFYNYMIDCEILYLETEFVDYERKNITDRKLTAAIWDDDLLDFCDLICYKILSEQRNYSNKELLEAFKQYYSEDKEIESAKITRALNKFIQIKNLKAIKNDRFYIEKQRVRGFVYLYEHKNHKSVVEFINSHESESEKNETTEQLPSDSSFTKTVILNEKDYSNDIPF